MIDKRTDRCSELRDGLATRSRDLFHFTLDASCSKYLMVQSGGMFFIQRVVIKWDNLLVVVATDTITFKRNLDEYRYLKRTGVDG